MIIFHYHSEFLLHQDIYHKFFMLSKLSTTLDVKCKALFFQIIYLIPKDHVNIL